MENQTKYPVIIIGAGPAGLALGRALQAEGIEFLIIEKGEIAGNSWANMPDHLRLISLWHSNCLIKEDISKFSRWKNLSAWEFSQYLSEFASRFNLPVKLQTKMLAVEKTDSDWLISTDKGELSSSIVVDCRGYFSFPYVPQLPGDNSLKPVHFNDFKNAQQFSGQQKICIVGKRLSAGQVIQELCEANPDIKIYLLARSKVHFSPPMFILTYLLKYLSVLEWLPLRMGIKKTVDIPMHASIKKYFLSNVILKKEIQNISGNKITFEDETVAIDSLIMATGYKRELIQLRNDFESKQNDNYFFLGINGQRTFTSRFLRGIREDAPVLAKLIRGRLASRNNCQ